MIKYPAIFFEDGNYIGVEFPDLPGCFSQADDLNNAINSARKALRCYLSNVEKKIIPYLLKIIRTRLKLKCILLMMIPIQSFLMKKLEKLL